MKPLREGAPFLRAAASPPSSGAGTPTVTTASVTARAPLAGGLETALVLAAVFLAALPHLPRLPPPALAAFLVALAWRALAWRAGWPLPARGRPLLLLLKYALAAGLFTHVLATSGGLGRDAGVALLVSLVGLKLLELRRRADVQRVVLMLLFLLVTGFFYSQTPAAALHMVLTVLLVLAALSAVHDPDRVLDARGRLRLCGLLMLQALPVLLVAWLLFPRLSGPLWGLPKDAFAGQSGLSEAMTPGSISELTLSDEAAFRVSFDTGSPPPAPERYFRGPVLWLTDGRSWRVDERMERLTAEPLRAEADTRVDYTLTLEPHHQRWALLLDWPASLPEGTQAARDFTVRYRRAVDQRVQYRAAAVRAISTGELGDLEALAGLQLPPAAFARSRSLAAGWRARTGGDAAALVEEALQHFRAEAFSYTLTPPMPEGDPVDDFLFVSRRGFCEHYAAAFVVLMRAAGVPARVVTGYQGGEWNASGGYLLVRQRDAHAWAEVWIEGPGWVRVDPTAAVAPERLEQGVTSSLPELAGALDAPGLRAVWLRFDALQNAWNQWVLGFDQGRQRRLLGQLGLPDPSMQRLALWLAVALAGVLLLLGLAWWAAGRRRPRPRDDAERALYGIERHYARRGFARERQETPLAWLERVAAAAPSEPLAAGLREFARLYEAARYAERPVGRPSLEAARRAATDGFRPSPE